MVKVLISDKLSPLAKEIFERRGIETDQIVGLSKEELEAKIHEYDGLAIRSATKVTPKILAAAKNLKVVGRAGIGVDNVDIPAATSNGVVVMNTPFGNSITTAEQCLNTCWQMGKISFYGCRANLKNAWYHRLRKYRCDCRQPRHWPQNESDCV